LHVERPRLVGIDQALALPLDLASPLGEVDRLSASSLGGALPVLQKCGKFSPQNFGLLEELRPELAGR
jgi:hypothetical protein